MTTVGLDINEGGKPAAIAVARIEQRKDERNKSYANARCRIPLKLDEIEGYEKYAAYPGCPEQRRDKIRAAEGP